jgi:hypothetical protein
MEGKRELVFLNVSYSAECWYDKAKIIDDREKHVNGDLICIYMAI